MFLFKTYLQMLFWTTETAFFEDFPAAMTFGGRPPSLPPVLGLGFGLRLPLHV